MGNITRETKILRENQKETLEIKNTLTQMKKVFYGLTSRVDTIKKGSVSLKICH